MTDPTPPIKRVPRSPVCAKAGLWSYPCSGRIELQKDGPMRGSFMCEEHAFQAKIADTPAEPSPAHPAEDDLTQLYEEAKRNGAGTYSGSHIIPLIEALTAAREERDRARDALQSADSMLSLIRHRGQFEPWTALTTISKFDEVIGRVRAALKPVSDQPEGETK